MFPFFLSSGLFLGWFLGANDAANIFGTAVGSRMIRFKTAAVLCSIFIILGKGFSVFPRLRPLWWSWPIPWSCSSLPRNDWPIF